MDYEKKYNEAVCNIQKLLENGRKEGEVICAYEADFMSIFPELKESEDERIRKELIKGISKTRPNTLFLNTNVTREDAIAWLEKQGTPAKLSEEEQNRLAKGVLTSCAMSFIDYLDAHKYEGKMCVSNGECEDIENAFHNAMWDRLHRYYCKYIEKQGEQNLANSVKTCKDEQKPKFRIGDTIKKESTGDIVTISEIDLQNREYRLSNTGFIPFKYENLWELVEQKPAKNEELTEFDKAVGVSIGTWNPKSPEQIQSVKAVSKKLLKLAKKQINDEQKPVEWSRDDEQYLLICKNALSKYQVSDKWDAGIISRWLEERLKSLRPQSTWKPSDEQIGALEHFIRSITESGFASPYDSNTKLVYSLLNDLKKLKL